MLTASYITYVQKDHDMYLEILDFLAKHALTSDHFLRTVLFNVNKKKNCVDNTISGNRPTTAA